MDKDVVENHRARGNSGYVIFDCSQTKSEVKLVARAIAQSSYFNLFFVLSNGN
jgi:23S rRNA C2498 (ribose-2'-O)-methylase RlmM